MIPNAGSFVILNVAATRHNRNFQDAQITPWIDLHCGECAAAGINCGPHQAMDGQRVMTVNLVVFIEPYRMRGGNFLA
jgi:hypothetical protein